MQDESARQRGWWKWKWKVLKSASLQIRKTIMAPKGLIWNVNKRTETEPKWKLANRGLKLRNDEVGIIKRSMKDQY